MDNLTKEQRSKIMSKIRGKDTKDEVRLAKALWRRGHRYRKHDRSIFGTPDLSFKKYKIAIFVDGEFFHGKNWETFGKRPKTNEEYWMNKIYRNMERDKEVNEYLLSKGWKVLRFWSTEIRKSLFKSIKTIENEIADARSKIFYK